MPPLRWGHPPPGVSDPVGRIGTYRNEPSSYDSADASSMPVTSDDVARSSPYDSVAGATGARCRSMPPSAPDRFTGGPAEPKRSHRVTPLIDSATGENALAGQKSGIRPSAWTRPDTD
ncbi:hypothetical protein GCM10010275_38780 [Streptomyces litmocidini]|nr:hypothetical protein GCM10010275_38780 [Streptomyces litmocidini]